jgi:hypothetical protein
MITWATTSCQKLLTAKVAKKGRQGRKENQKQIAGGAIFFATFAAFLCVLRG